MKIRQDLRAQLETSTKTPNQQSVGGKKFEELVSTQTKQLQQDELNRLMKDLSAQGERLARFRSFQDLAKYKRMVKDFVQEAVQYGMNVKQSHSFSFDGRGRKLTTIEEVDEKLMELTEAVMAQEKKPIDLLGIIGEIKGLLINLYT